MTKRVCGECAEEKELESDFQRNREWYRGVCRDCRNGMERLNYYNRTHRSTMPCEKCKFLGRCQEKIWDMWWWPYCMRKDGN
jgi:hypothetical protein